MSNKLEFGANNIFQKDYGHQTNSALVLPLCVYGLFCLILTKDLWNVATKILIENQRWEYRGLTMLHNMTKVKQTEISRDGS